MQKQSIVLVAGLVGVLSAGHAQALSITRTGSQIDFDDFLTPGTPTTIAQLDFSGPDLSNLLSIDSIEVTLTLQDGDTAPGNLDEDTLSLGLAGFDTGLLLNGFPNSQAFVTLTIEGPNNSSQILDSLQQNNGFLDVSIFSSGSNFTGEGNFVESQASDELTLTLTGTSNSVTPIPSPAAAGIGLIGGLSLLARRGRGKRG